MKLTKKILLALIFCSSFYFAIDCFINGILNLSKVVWFVSLKGGDIFWWVFFAIFFLAAISSFLWVTNKAERFWFLKIPALVILPFSIPFLIIDFVEYKKGQRFVQPNYYENYQLYSTWNSEEFTSLVILVVGLTFNYLLIFLQLAFLIVISSQFPWVLAFTIVPFLFFLGSISLLINYFKPHHNAWTWLKMVGKPFNWFHLSLTALEKSENDYLFKIPKIVIRQY